MRFAFSSVILLIACLVAINLSKFLFIEPFSTMESYVAFFPLPLQTSCSTRTLRRLPLPVRMLFLMV